MKNVYDNVLGSERTVEVEFINYCIDKFIKKTDTVLDVGGIPTKARLNQSIVKKIYQSGFNYEISDFRGGTYQGDFVTYNFPKKFDSIIFLSSLEHFPQCTEGDCVYRDGEDRRGYEKALSILEDKGKIFLTVPFGKPVWQNYHQNYDMDLIKKLSEGSKLIETHTYRLINNKWEVREPDTMLDVLYDRMAYGVGCFVFEKGRENEKG